MLFQFLIKLRLLESYAYKITLIRKLRVILLETEKALSEKA